MSPSSTCTLCLVLVACVSHVITYPHAGVSTTTPTPPHPYVGAMPPSSATAGRADSFSKTPQPTENPAAHVWAAGFWHVGCGQNPAAHAWAAGKPPQPSFSGLCWQTVLGFWCFRSFTHMHL